MRVLNFTLVACVLLALYFLLPTTTASEAIALDKVTTTALSSALTAFKAEYGSYPEGRNREILSQLMGGNPRRIVFIELKPEEIGSNGEFLDPWKHPYQINLTDDPKKPHLWSLGKNGIDDSANDKSDDLRSWE